MIARLIKEQMLHVPMDYDYTMSGPDLINEETRSYELPGGEIIQVDKETRVTAAEALFRPSLLGYDGAPIQQMVFDAINKCDNDLKTDLFGSIVLVGGTSMTKGFVERMESEIYNNLPSDLTR
jgi:actin-related protein